MAPRLNHDRPPPAGFPSWAEFSAIALLVLWLVGLVTLQTPFAWVHLLLPVAFGILAISFWNNRSPRGDS
jgi:hypothetical protein